MEAIHEKQQGGDDWRDGVLKTERGCRNSDTIKMHVLLQSKPGSSKQWVWELVGCGNEETRKIVWEEALVQHLLADKYSCLRDCC
jgi:hypothetical protein